MGVNMAGRLSASRKPGCFTAFPLGYRLDLAGCVLVSFTGNGQIDKECGAFTKYAGGPDFAAVGFYDFPGNGQTEPATIIGECLLLGSLTL